MSIKVVLIEDDHDLGAALSEYLELSGFQVHWVASGIEFYALAAETSEFQVAIVDIGLPDQSGLVLAEYIRRNSQAGVIVLTANDSVERSAESYRLGADLFMAKPVDNDVLVAAIASMAERSRQRVLVSPGGDTADSSRLSSDWRFDERRRQLTTPDGEVISLTRQECRVCALLAAAPQQSVERAEALEVMYGRQDDSAQRALDTLFSRLRRKITNITEQPAPILTDYGIGHSFSEPLEVIQLDCHS